MPGRLADSNRVGGRRFQTWVVIATGAALLAIVGASRLLARPPRTVGAAGAAAQTATSVEPPPSHTTAPIAVAAPSQRPPRLADRGLGSDRAVAAIRKRNLLALEHEERVLEHADEQAFDAVQMPDRLRVSVRNLNDDWTQKRRAMLGDEVAGRAPADEALAADSGNAALDRTRREALMQRLGMADFAAFQAAETAALDRLGERYPGWAERVGKAARPTFDLNAR
jgi:hypothetical protein